MTEHTPTPWEIRKDDEGAYIGAKDGDRYIRIVQICGSLLNPSIAADAALIVRAVNSHAALVEALGHALERLEAHQESAYCQLSGYRDNEAVDKARAALKLARKE